jgi:hypothetical protein
MCGVVQSIAGLNAIPLQTPCGISASRQRKQGRADCNNHQFRHRKSPIEQPCLAHEGNMTQAMEKSIPLSRKILSNRTAPVHDAKTAGLERE